MTKLSSEGLSKEDLRFLLNLLRKAEEESNTKIVIDGDNKSEDNKSEATTALKRIRPGHPRTAQLMTSSSSCSFKLLLKTFHLTDHNVI
jgi:hypothetical protein